MNRAGKTARALSPNLFCGLHFDSSATLYIDADKQKKTSNEESSPSTMLVARKSGKLISPGQTVILQVKNSDNSLSNEYLFKRPVE